MSLCETQRASDACSSSIFTPLFLCLSLSLSPPLSLSLSNSQCLFTTLLSHFLSFSHSRSLSSCYPSVSLFSSSLCLPAFSSTNTSPTPPQFKVLLFPGRVLCALCCEPCDVCHKEQWLHQLLVIQAVWTPSVPRGTFHITCFSTGLLSFSLSLSLSTFTLS